MTLREWLQAREPRPPVALSRRMQEVLGDAMSRDAEGAADILLETSERLAAQMLASGATSRDSALDLLVADALVTYAFEAASSDAASIPDRAERAMRGIATLGFPSA